MTTSVHEDHDSYVDDDEYVEVGRLRYMPDGWGEPWTRIEYESKERTCLKPMRGWSAQHPQRDETTGRRTTIEHEHHGFCLLDKDHRGRHSTVVFYCDGCGKTLRGEPYSMHREQDVQFCYSCASPNGGWW